MTDTIDVFLNGEILGQYNSTYGKDWVKERWDILEFFGINKDDVLSLMINSEEYRMTIKTDKEYNYE